MLRNIDTCASETVENASVYQELSSKKRRRYFIRPQSDT